MWNRTYSPTLLDHVAVATRVSTDLKIALVGDSLGYQFFLALEDALTVPNVTEHLPLYYTFKKIHEGLTLVSPVRGAGIMAFWRMTGMWIDSYMYQPLPYKGKGWLPQHATLLLNTTLQDNLTTRTINAMDAMVFRIPFGWIRGTDVTLDSLNQTVQHAREFLQVKCVILVSMFFNNIVQSLVDWKDLQEGNERIRQFAAENDFPILVLNMDRLLHGIMEANAVELGMTNYSSWINASIQERLPAKTHPQSVLHVCSKRPTAVGAECEYNFVSLDGMHLCMETLGGRITAGIACLLGCFFNNEEEDVGVDYLVRCERECNARYMNPNAVLGQNNMSSSLVEVNK